MASKATRALNSGSCLLRFDFILSGMGRFYSWRFQNASEYPLGAARQWVTHFFPDQSPWFHAVKGFVRERNAHYCCGKRLFDSSLNPPVTRFSRRGNHSLAPVRIPGGTSNPALRSKCKERYSQYYSTGYSSCISSIKIHKHSTVYYYC